MTDDKRGTSATRTRFRSAVPKWLRDAIKATRAARAVQLDRCRHCKAETLAGIDDDRCGFPAVADLTPVDQLGEALAILEGRATYTFRRGSRGYVLARRHAPDITAEHRRGRPAGADVLVEHRCDPQNGTKFPQVATRITRPPNVEPKGASHDLPPY